MVIYSNNQIEGTSQEVPFLDESRVEELREKEVVIVTWGGSLPATGAAGGIDLAAKEIFEKLGIPVHYVGSSAANFAHWMVQVAGITDPEELSKMLSEFKLSELVSIPNLLKTGNVLPEGTLERVFKEYVANIPKNGSGTFDVITSIASDSEKFPFITSIENDDDKNFLLLELTCAINGLINSREVQRELFKGIYSISPYPKNPKVEISDGDLNNAENVMDLIRYKYPDAIIINCYVKGDNPLRKLIKAPTKFTQDADYNISISSNLAPIKLPFENRSKRSKSLRVLFNETLRGAKDIFKQILEEKPGEIKKDRFEIVPEF